MKAAIFNPYLDTLGGGELYTASFIKVLLSKKYEVFLQWKDEDIVGKLEKRFGMSLDGLKVVKDIERGDGLDVCFWVSDGSIPTLRSRKNILHFQVPFSDVNGKTLLNKMKFFRIEKVVCNSEFTKQIVDKEYGVDSIVIYPPVNTKKFKPLKKENIILYVGRFSGLKQSKNQEVLVKAFKKFYSSEAKNWKLVLAGGVEVGNDGNTKRLKSLSKGYPIEILESPSFDKLKSLYGRAKIFWSAAGYGVDEKKEPEKVEHFGITPIEAMASGAVPFIFDAGGHREIVENGKNGFLWKTRKELVKKTADLIGDSKMLTSVARKARERSVVFSYEEFKRQIEEIL